MPKYQVLSTAEVSWQEDGHILQGTEVEVLLIPDTQFEHPYEVETVDPDTGKIVRTTQVKSDWNEVQKFRIVEGDDMDVVLSKAAWNHEDGIAALEVKMTTPPPEDGPEDPVDAIPRDQLT